MVESLGALLYHYWVYLHLKRLNYNWEKIGTAVVFSKHFAEDICAPSVAEINFMHNCFQFENALTPQCIFCHFTIRIRRSSVVKLKWTSSCISPEKWALKIVIAEMNIAGPSGTNKQLPKPLPPPQPLLSTVKLQRKTSLKYLSALISLLVYDLEAEWDPVTCDFKVTVM